MKNIHSEITNLELEETLCFLEKLIACKTVRGEAKEGAPFGEENLRCLQAFLQKGEELGFETKNVDGYAGHVEWKCGKENAKLFGILGHLDVVPEGSGWDTPPFEMVRRDGKILGRGVQDDKGPMAIVLYALSRLKQTGFVPKKDIRIIVGCNEENGSSCVKHYFSKERMPDIAISPDSDFPAIHSEKGIVWVEVLAKVDFAGIKQISCGEKLNMVPDFGVALANFPLSACDAEKYRLTFDSNKNTIACEGAGAHGSMPEMGDNSARRLLDFAISKLAKENGEMAKFLSRFSADTNGEALGIFSACEKSGETTCNLGRISYIGGELKMGLDIRYPQSISKEEIEKNIMENAPEGCSVRTLNSQHSLFVDPEDPLVSLCEKAYKKHTGEDAKSKKIGGGTYARELKYGIAVGPVFDGVPTTIHGKNEHMTEREFALCFDIYLDIMREILARE